MSTMRFARALPMAILAVVVVTFSAQAAGEGTRFVKVTKERAESGKMLYQRCAVCHGSKGVGRVGMAPRLTSETFLEAASDEMLTKTITLGRMGTTMVPWGGQLKADQIGDIIAYIRHLEPTEPATLDESPLRGNAKNGAKVYRQICAMCHGRSGAGYMESGSGTGIGRKAFLDQVSDGYMRYIIKKGKSDTGMRPFSEKSKVAVANLSDAEIEDIIAHLRASAW